MNSRQSRGLLRALAATAAAMLVSAMTGCATAPAGKAAAPDPKDPYEGFNRKVFAFNDKLDTYALKPAATAYVKTVPSPVRTGVNNFFGNFKDAWSAVNELLQGKADDSARMTMRVLTNTIIGIGGVFDIATPLGLERKQEDFGQTLGRWGLEPGPYLVLPVFGPSDIRDTVALPADTYVSPSLLTDNFWQGLAVGAVGAIDARANLLGASQTLDDIALDRYSFLRDAYMARRRSQVHDGNPPPSPGVKDDDGDYDPGATTSPAPAAPAPGAKTSQAGETFVVAAAAANRAAQDESAPMPSSPLQPVPGGVQPAPLPASAPPLPVPPPGPVPVPPPPASAVGRG